MIRFFKPSTSKKRDFIKAIIAVAFIGMVWLYGVAVPKDALLLHSVTTITEGKENSDFDFTVPFLPKPISKFAFDPRNDGCYGKDLLDGESYVSTLVTFVFTDGLYGIY